MDAWNAVVLLVGCLAGSVGFTLKQHKERDDERIADLQRDVHELRQRIDGLSNGR
jgi:uncharacterized membrane protein